MESKIGANNDADDDSKTKKEAGVKGSFSNIRPFTYYYREMLKKYGKRSSKQAMKEFASKWKAFSEDEKRKYKDLSYSNSQNQQKA